MIAVNPQVISIGTHTHRSHRLVLAAFLALGFAFLLASTAGCAPSERQRAQTVSDQFLDAMSQEDWSRAKPLLTEKARDAMGSMNPFSQDGEGSGKAKTASSGSDSYTLGEPKIDDVLAAVPVTLVRSGHTNVGTLRLRREDGEWRVRALRIEGENGSSGITLDFENPEEALLGAGFRAIGEGIGELLKGIGQGIGAFMEGVGKGAESGEKSPENNAPKAMVSPEPSPDSDNSVRVEEHTSGS